MSAQEAYCHKPNRSPHDKVDIAPSLRSFPPPPLPPASTPPGQTPPLRCHPPQLDGDVPLQLGLGPDRVHTTDRLHHCRLPVSDVSDCPDINCSLLGYDLRGQGRQRGRVWDRLRIEKRGGGCETRPAAPSGWRRFHNKTQARLR